MTTADFFVQPRVQRIDCFLLNCKHS